MLSIKQASLEVDLSPHTIRYYESEGLLPFLKRDEQGNRFFEKGDIEWIQFICCLRNTGMSIREMKSFVDLYKGGNETIPERMDILYNHKSDLEVKLEEMKKYLRNIDWKIEYYEKTYNEFLGDREDKG